MKGKRYFQVSLLLPLIVPLIVLLFFKPSFAYGGVTMILTFSLYLGGIPYVLFVIGLFFWMRRKDAREIQRMTFISPLLYAGFFVLCAVAFVPIQYLLIGDVRIEANVVLLCCVVILVLGYSYVLVVNAGYAVLKLLKVT